jgi:hypothetical protein
MLAVAWSWAMESMLLTGVQLLPSGDVRMA